MNKILTLLLIGLATQLVSCKNDLGPGTAEIKVVDEDGVAQKAINVLLYCTEDGCIVRREGITNEVGVYTQQFDLPVVLRVRAVRYDSTVTFQGLPPNEIKVVVVDSICGEGFIQVEHDEVTKEVVTILECK